MSPQRKQTLLRHAEDFACAVLVVFITALVLGLSAMLTAPISG